MRLGESRESRAAATQKAPLKVSAPIRLDPDYEVIWYPHRDALALLPDDYPAIDAAVQTGLPDLKRTLRSNALDAYQGVNQR
jgi:hypothetical protein